MDYQGEAPVCPRCAGTGEGNSGPVGSGCCDQCHGSGHLYEEESYEYDVDFV